MHGDAARLAVSLMWFLMTMPMHAARLGERGEVDVVHVAAEHVRVRAYASITPTGGLTLGGGGGKAAWPKACVAANAAVSTANLILRTSLDVIITSRDEENPFLVLACAAALAQAQHRAARAASACCRPSR
jgi:hypothetical protein